MITALKIGDRNDIINQYVIFGWFFVTIQKILYEVRIHYLIFRTLPIAWGYTYEKKFCILVIQGYYISTHVLIQVQCISGEFPVYSLKNKAKMLNVKLAFLDYM